MWPRIIPCVPALSPAPPGKGLNLAWSQGLGIYPKIFAGAFCGAGIPSQPLFVVEPWAGAAQHVWDEEQAEPSSSSRARQAALPELSMEGQTPRGGGHTSERLLRAPVLLGDAQSAASAHVAPEQSRRSHSLRSCLQLPHGSVLLGR